MTKTLDGSENSAPVDMVNFPFFTRLFTFSAGFLPSKVP